MSSKLSYRAEAVLFLCLLPSVSFGHWGAQNPLDAVGRLLLADAIEEAEGILEELSEASDVLAFNGEIEFRRAKFEEARALF